MKVKKYLSPVDILKNGGLPVDQQKKKKKKKGIGIKTHRRLELEQ